MSTVPALPILTGEKNPILRTPAQKVAQLSKDIKRLLEGMRATVREAEGIGLAAPQVGVSARVILAQIAGKFLAMVNPEILTFSTEKKIKEEGCLSLPGQWGMVERPREISVRFMNERGETLELFLKDLEARVVQHEVDHLNGILFIDRLYDGVIRKGGKKVAPEKEALSA